MQVAAYEFTTLTCIPGVVRYNGAKIQLLDLPGIIEGAKDGKGRGRQVSWKLQRSESGVEVQIAVPCVAASDALLSSMGVMRYNTANIQLLDLPGVTEWARDGKGRGPQVPLKLLVLGFGVEVQTLVPCLVASDASLSSTGVMRYNGARMQLLELPGIAEWARDRKGQGPQAPLQVFGCRAWGWGAESDPQRWSQVLHCMGVVRYNSAKIQRLDPSITEGGKHGKG